MLFVLCCIYVVFLVSTGSYALLSNYKELLTYLLSSAAIL